MKQRNQHVVIIGAGVTGVTTAYALARRGFRVTVVDRHDGPGLETSRANAGQRSYGHVAPWASPAMIRHALPWLLQQDGPLKMPLPPSFTTLAFLARTLRFALTPGRYHANSLAMLQLAAYSRQCFLDLERDLALDFDGEHQGLIKLASSAATLTELEDTATLLDQVGIPFQWLDAAQVRRQEPGMTGDAPLRGGLRLTSDGTGDCHRFTRALAAVCEDIGVGFHYGHTVVSVNRSGGRVQSLSLEDGTSSQTLTGDHFVLCAGCESRTLGAMLGERLPIYPVKGYSLTAALADPDLGPRSTVLDDRFKVVATRLGKRLRVTGFVELADFSRRIPQQRLATIRRAVTSRFPGAADLEQAQPWTGFRPMTPDGPPVVGPGRLANVTLNTGHGTFGWTLSAACAELTAQLLSDEAPALALAPFRANRLG